MKNKKILSIIILVIAALKASPQNAPAADKQEICVLINVVDHDYEKINRATFEKINSIGYKTIELGNYMKPFSESLEKRYSEFNFNTLACGGSLYDLQQNIDSVIIRGLLLHQKYVICYWPWLVGSNDVNLEQCKKSAEIMNNLAEKCRKAGMQFAFHNHDIEFKKIDGKLICDYLFELTDPSLVFLEFDIYYAYKTDLDAIKFMDEHAGRIKILHLFAMDDKKVNQVGDGMQGFDAIIKKSREMGIKYLVVEGNHLENPLLYLENSFKRLRELTK
jgi:sugar phosphate isomerase/epimerase